MVDRGEIKTKDNRILCEWESQGISKETRYRLYQIEEGMKEIREDKQIPIIYPKKPITTKTSETKHNNFNDDEGW